MDMSNDLPTSRRDFIAKIFPGGILSYCVSQRLLGSALLGEVPPSQEDEHKFEKEMDQKITYKQWIQQRHIKYIEILKHLENDIGKEKLLEMLKKASYEENVKLGKRLSGRIPSLQVFANPFRNDTSNLSKTIVREIIEDSDTAFEIQITECLTEIVFREADALGILDLLVSVMLISVFRWVSIQN